MNKVVLYANGASGNHGCEALSRSLYKILKKDFAINLASYDEQEDKKYFLDKLMPIFSLAKVIDENSIRYLLYRIKQSLFYSDISYYKMIYSDFIKNVDTDALYLSIGGDNYSYGNNDWLAVLNQGIYEKGGKTILLGCSILDNISDRNMIDDLSKYTVIIARESITYNALKRLGLKNQLYSVPDPAFQLDRVDAPLPEGFISGNTVGINVSPMVIEREGQEGIIMENYCRLIEHIIKHTDMQIALIPHVVWTHNDDRVPLRKLYEKFKRTDRVVMIDDACAEVLKGFIARCRFMVAARTHASIAAYSECVPTLVVGYSVKARGIATDILGTWDKYVLPVTEMHTNDALLTAFTWIMQNEEFIRTKFQSMRDYKVNTFQIRDILLTIR